MKQREFDVMLLKAERVEAPLGPGSLKNMRRRYSRWQAKRRRVRLIRSLRG